MFRKMPLVVLIGIAGAASAQQSGQDEQSDIQVQIAQQERQLESLKQIYTEQHPAVMRAEQTLTELRGQLATSESLRDRIAMLQRDLAELTKIYTSQHPEVISTELRLEQLEQELADFE